MVNLWKREKGQSLVELALLLPILLLILLGIIDFGRVFYAYVTITNASREGARYGSLYPLQDNVVKQRVIDEAANTVTIEAADITVTKDDSQTITVTVQIDFQTLFFGNLPYIRDWMPGGAFAIRAQTAMPILEALE